MSSGAAAAAARPSLQPVYRGMVAVMRIHSALGMLVYGGAGRLLTVQHNQEKGFVC